MKPTGHKAISDMTGGLLQEPIPLSILKQSLPSVIGADQDESGPKAPAEDAQQ